MGIKYSWSQEMDDLELNIPDRKYLDSISSLVNEMIIIGLMPVIIIVLGIIMKFLIWIGFFKSKEEKDRESAANK